MNKQINTKKKFFEVDLDDVPYDELLKFCKINRYYDLILTKHKMKCYKHQLLGLCTFEVHSVPQYVMNFILHEYGDDTNLFVPISQLDPVIFQYLFDMYIYTPKSMKYEEYSLEITKMDVLDGLNFLFDEDINKIEPGYNYHIKLEGYTGVEPPCTCKK